MGKGVLRACLVVLGLAASLFLAGMPCHAVSWIADADIRPTTGDEVDYGNGVLDCILFWEGGGVGVSENSAGGFNGDDANGDMPLSATTTASESFVTSIGDLRDFYTLNFPNGLGGSMIAEIALFVDVNQYESPDLYLDTLTVVIDYLDGTGSPFGDDRDDPAAPTDVSSVLQESTGANFTGTILAQLDSSPKYIGVNEVGAGWADYIIALGINPFDPAFSDSDRILFHWESHGHDDGGETIYLSGTYGIIPEPSAFVLVALGGLGVLVRRREK